MSDAVLSSDEILFTIEPRWCAACALLPAKLCRGIAIRSIEPQDILVLHRVQCVRIPMKKLNYDRITTTIEREWLAEIIAVEEDRVPQGQAVLDEALREGLAAV